MLPINNTIQSPEQYLSEVTRLVDIKQMDLAQFVCAKFIAQFPQNAMAALVMARIFNHNAENVQAVKYVTIAASLLNSRSAWSDVLSVSTTLQVVGEDELARRVLDVLEMESPDNKPALPEIASQFSTAGDQEQSLRWFDYAKTQGHTGFAVNHHRGKVLTYTGPIDEAAKALETAIEFKPDSGNAHWSIAVLDQPSGRRARVERMKAVCETGALASLEEQFLHLALFREYDRLDEVDNAWRHLDIYTKLRRKEVQYNSAVENTDFDNLIHASQFLRDVAPVDAALADPAIPIFILGMPRTGTTLLERMLGNYNEVQPCGELTIIRSQLQFLSKGFAIPFDSSLATALANIDLHVLGQRYMDKTRWRREGKAYFTDKHPINFSYAGIIAKALPQARIINLMRNPMDTCFSNLKEFFGPMHYTYSYQQDELANHYKNYRKLMAHWHKIAPGRILDVHYERLVMQPESEAERVRLFCGLPKLDGLSDISNNIHVTTTASTVQLREPVHKRNIEAWTKYEKYLGELKDLLSVEQHQYQTDIQSLS